MINLEIWAWGSYGNSAAADISDSTSRTSPSRRLSRPIRPLGGKLLNALCFSSDIMQHMEKKYGAEVVGLSTRGGCGTNSVPYQRIKPSSASNCRSGDLFEKVVPKNPSLNASLDYFSDDTIRASLTLHKSCSTESSAPHADYLNDRSLRHEIIRWAFRQLGISRRAAYVNEVGLFWLDLG